MRGSDSQASIETIRPYQGRRAMPDPERSALRAAGPAALAVCVIIFLAPLLFTGKIYFFRDHPFFFLPMKASVARALQAGTFPFWQPEFSLGIPFFETWQPALLYPPTLIFLLAPFPQSYNLFLAFHLFAAALGAYLAAMRLLGCRRTALCAALLFAFGGTTISMINLLNLLQAAAWAPWSLLCFAALSAGGRRTRFWWIALAGIFALQLLAGGPEIVLMELGLLAFYAAWTSGRGGKRKLARKLFTGLLLPFVMSCALASVQILPTADFMSRTSRLSGMEVEDTLGFSLNPIALYNLLLPRDYVDPEGSFGQRGVIDAGYPGSEYSFPYFLSLYHGCIFLPLVAAWWAGLAWRRRLLAAGAGMAVLAAASVGAIPGAVDWLKESGFLLPGFRYPCKLFFIWSAAAIAAATAGLHSVVHGDGGARRTALAALLAVALFGACLWAVCSWTPGRVGASIAEVTDVSHGASLDVFPYKIAALRETSRRCTFLALILGGVIAYGCGRGRRGNGTVLLIPVVLAADLFIAHMDLNWPVEAGPILEPPRSMLAMGERAGEVRILVNGIGPKDFDPGLTYYENLRRYRLDWLSPDLNALHGISSLISSAAFINHTDRHRWLEGMLRGGLSPEGFTRIMRALNVGYFLTTSPYEAPGVRALDVTLDRGSLLEISGTWGGAYMARSAVFRGAADHQAYRSWFNDPTRPDMEVLVGDPSVAASCPDEAEGRVEVHSKDWNTQGLQVETSTGGLVVVADFFEPGWKAEVDGRPAEIVEVFGVVMGIVVGPGSHELTLVYRPRLFLVGALISLASLAALIVLAVLRGPSVSSIARPERG